MRNAVLALQLCFYMGIVRISEGMQPGENADQGAVRGVLQFLVTPLVSFDNVVPAFRCWCYCCRGQGLAIDAADPLPAAQEPLDCLGRLKPCEEATHPLAPATSMISKKSLATDES